MMSLIDDNQLDLALRCQKLFSPSDHREIDIGNKVWSVRITLCEFLERIFSLYDQFPAMSGPQDPILRGIQHACLIESVDRLDASKRLAAGCGDNQEEAAAWFLCEVRNDVGYGRLLELVVTVLNTDSAHWRSRGRGIVRAPSTSASCCWGAPLSFS